MPQHPGELAKHECVNFRYQSTGQSLRWPFRDAQGITEFIPKPGITADVSDAVAAVMVAGGGIGMSPTYLSSMYVKRGLLVQVLPEHFYDRSSITALWPESRRDNPNVRSEISSRTGPLSTMGSLPSGGASRRYPHAGSRLIAIL
jgi:DNA-binding transcriptional LysR family regulator